MCAAVRPERRPIPLTLYYGSHTAVPLTKLISGGQSGVDRAALDAALNAGVPTGGWCPRGRLAEDGPIPTEYPLTETATADVAVRTELNVLDSHATLILTVGQPQDGTILTKTCAVHHGRPLLEIRLDDPPSAADVLMWIEKHGVSILNVAGPRESYRPGFVYHTALDFLLAVLRTVKHPDSKVVRKL